MKKLGTEKTALIIAIVVVLVGCVFGLYESRPQKMYDKCIQQNNPAICAVLLGD